MKKFFKKLVYFSTIIVFLIPFIVCVIFGATAWLMFSLYDLVFEWAHEV